MWAVVAAAVVVGATACGGSAERTSSELGVETLGRSASALVCSPQGEHQVVLSGDAQNITESSYTCTGVHPVQALVTVKILPGPAPGKWLVTFAGIGTQPHQFTITEKNGIIDWSMTGSIAPENYWVGCGYMGSLTLHVDETTIAVSQYCHYLSGLSGCKRYSQVSGTAPRGCAPVAEPDAGAADAASDPDTSASSPDASAATDAGVDAADVGMDAATSAPVAPTPAPSGAPEPDRETREPALPSADEAPAAPAVPTAASCAASGASPASSGAAAFLGLALATAIALARRRSRGSNQS